MRQRNLLRPDRMGRITCATRIYWRASQPDGDTSEAEGIHAAVRRSGMTVYDECGHFLRWKHPERFAADSVAFLMPAEACP